MGILMRMGKCIYTTSVWLHLGVGKLGMFYSNNASLEGCFVGNGHIIHNSFWHVEGKC